LQERRIFADELKLCALLTHRNIVFCHGGYIAPPRAPFPAAACEPDFIIFERCEASLSHYLSCRYDEERPHPLWYREGLDVGISILNALHWIHPNVTHGDLSTSNILVKKRMNKDGINTMCVMIADFETARVKERAVMQHREGRGTAAFMPPSGDDDANIAAGRSADWIYQVRLRCALCLSLL
jgi:serine/threonine protein kinase